MRCPEGAWMTCLKDICTFVESTALSCSTQTAAATTHWSKRRRSRVARENHKWNQNNMAQQSHNNMAQQSHNNMAQQSHNKMAQRATAPWPSEPQYGPLSLTSWSHYCTYLIRWLREPPGHATKPNCADPGPDLTLTLFSTPWLCSVTAPTGPCASLAQHGSCRRAGFSVCGISFYIFVWLLGA